MVPGVTPEQVQATVYQVEKPKKLKLNNSNFCFHIGPLNQSP